MNYKYIEIFDVDGQLIVADNINKALQLAMLYNVLDKDYEPSCIRRITPDYPLSQKAIMEG